jgi:D-alanyl-D-alanine carboxypeptidase (penicillin-binding protein 5/6)
MGGSQVFLEEGESMPVREMLKCIVVSSANDAAVAMAEYIAGTEQSFVSMMNSRAEELGMTNTHFGNCTGLLKDPAHLTTARDISIMSRELIRHDWIKEYTTIWMDTIRDGTFGLSNTNKLVRYYQGATGLKTGFTSSAGYCLSATAERDGVEFIAVVLHCETTSDRFESAKTLLSYAFSNYTVVSAIPDEVLMPVPVTLGTCDYVQPVLGSEESILMKKSDVSKIEKTVELSDGVTAPVEEGQILGSFTMTLDGEELLKTDIVASSAVSRLSVWSIFKNFVRIFFCGDS